MTSRKTQYQQNIFKFSLNSAQQEQLMSPNSLQPDKNIHLQPIIGNGSHYNTQKSKLMSKQNSNCLLPSLSNELNYQNKNNFNGHATVMFAIQEQMLVEQDYHVSKKRKKIQYVLLGKSKEEVMAKALRHFKDAILLRPPRNAFESNIKFGDYFLHFYELRWTLPWCFLQKTLSYLYIILSFLEPQTEAGDFSDSSTQNFVFYSEILILLFCFLDTLLSLYIYRPSMKNPFLKVISYFNQFSLLIIFFLDFILFWHTQTLQIRFSSMLRPLWLLKFHKEIQNIIKSMLRCSRRVIDLFLFFIIWSCFWGYIGYNLLSEYKIQFQDDITFVFGSIGESILGMYTLFSLDTYPKIVENIIKDNPYYLIFFVPYVAMNLFFFLCIPVAVIFENYKQQRAFIYLKDDQIMKDALTYCYFSLIHYNKDDYLSRDQFFNLMNLYYKNKAYRSKIDDLYSILNIDRQEKMTLYEFQDVVALMKTSERLYNNSNVCWDSFRGFCNKYLYLEKISRSPYWAYFILFIVFANTVAYIYYSVSTVYSDTSNLDDIYSNIEIFFLCIYISDVLIKLIGLGVNEYFEDYWNNFDFFMAIVSIITIIGLKYIYFIKETKSTKLIKITKLQRVLKIFRSIRSIKLLSFLKLGADALLRVQKLFHKVAICVPSVWGFVTTYFLISLSYGFIGIYLFNSNDQPAISNPYNTSDYTDFNTIQNALLSLFQVTAENKWTDFLYGYGYTTSLPLSAAYFCTYHMFSIFFLMSLIKGIIWDVFGVVESYLKEQEYDELADMHNSQSQEQSHLQENVKNDEINKYCIKTEEEEEETDQIQIKTFHHTNKQFGKQKIDRDEVVENGQFFRNTESQNCEALVTEPAVINLGEEEKNSYFEKNTLLVSSEQKNPKLSNYHNQHISEILKMQQESQKRSDENTQVDQNNTEEEKDSDLLNSDSSENPQSTNKNSSIIQEQKKNSLNNNKKQIQINNYQPEKKKNFPKELEELEEKPAEEASDTKDFIQKKMIASEESRFIVRLNTGQDSPNSSILLGQKNSLYQSQSKIENMFNQKISESSFQFNNNNLISLNSTSQNSPQQKLLFSDQITLSTKIGNKILDPIFCVKEDSENFDDQIKSQNNQQIDQCIEPVQQKDNKFENLQNNLLIQKTQSGQDQLNLSRINFQVPSILNKKNLIGSIRRSESSNISNDREFKIDFQIKKPDSNFDKYYKKRSHPVNIQVDINAQLAQLERYLQLYDQHGLQVADQRRQRIIEKYQNINAFSISKQFALQRRTYLKDNPLNINYVSRQDYLDTIEQLLGYSDDIKSFLNQVNIPAQKGNNNKTSKNKNRFRQMFQKYYQADANQKGKNNQNDEQNTNYNNDIKFNTQNDNQNFGSISELGELESQYPSYTAFEQLNSMNMKKEICDYTFIRLNGIFSFFLHLITNFNHFELKFAIEKLFVVEQSINQLIFGDYDENHGVNHFKFIFYSDKVKQYFALIKEPEAVDSNTDQRCTSMQDKKIEIEVCQLPNQNAPWTALGKSLEKENQIYFIKSLFSEIESNDEKAISRQLSDNIQFMGGQQYCLEDLTQYQIEQYSSFIFTNKNGSYNQKPQINNNSYVSNNNNNNNQAQSFMSFICNKQKRKFPEKKPEQKQSKQLGIQKTQIIDPKLNKIPENQINTGGKNNTHQMNDNNLEQNSNNTPKIVINPSSMLSNSQKLKVEDDIRKQSLFSRQNQANITKNSSQLNKILFKKDQENIIKIYSQLQKFFFTHSHQLDQIVSKLSFVINQQIPCYEYK